MSYPTPKKMVVKKPTTLNTTKRTTRKTTTSKMMKKKIIILKIKSSLMKVHNSSRKFTRVFKKTKANIMIRVTKIHIAKMSFKNR